MKVPFKKMRSSQLMMAASNRIASEALMSWVQVFQENRIGDAEFLQACNEVLEKHNAVKAGIELAAEYTGL